MLTAAGDGNFVGRVLEPVLALHFSGNCFAQFRRTIGRSVFGVAAFQSCDAGLLDRFGRIEVGLADVE